MFLSCILWEKSGLDLIDTDPLFVKPGSFARRRDPRLVSGVEGPGELALLESNGNGAIDLSDSVYVLGYLFTGRGPPVRGGDCTAIAGCQAGRAGQGARGTRAPESAA